MNNIMIHFYCDTTCDLCGSLCSDGKCPLKHDGTTCDFCGSLCSDGKCPLKHDNCYKK